MKDDKSSQQSVLAVIDDLADQFVGAVVAAQQEALRSQLPLCVVYCIADDQDAQSLQKQLQAIEIELAQSFIPFMVLRGDQVRVLPAVTHHLKPVRVYHSGQDHGTVKHSIQPHPIEWPGTIINVETLIENDLSC